MPALPEYQHALARHLLSDPDPEALGAVIGSASAAARLEVYRHTVRSTLTQALTLGFPAIRRLVGEDFFLGAAAAFIGAQPPRSACLNDYGAEFPDVLEGFVRTHAPGHALAYLADVARLEWAVNVALHAPDADPLDLGRLGALTAADWAALSFVPHPALTLLALAHPADAIWRAVLEQDSAAMGAIDPAAGPVQLLIERRDGVVQVRRVEPVAFGFAQALAAGRPLHAILDVGAAALQQALLADHLAAGRFIDLRLPEPR